MANPITKLEDVIKDLSGLMPHVREHIQNAIEAYNYSLQRLSYNSTTILDVIAVSKYIDHPLFSDMVRYMLNGDKPIERRLLVEKEIKRFIKLEEDEDNSKVKGIIENPTYQDRFFYVFGKKQRV
jgi:predicted Zn-dependent protease